MTVRLKVAQEPDILLDTPKAGQRTDLTFLERHLFRFHRFQPWRGMPEHLKIYALSYPADEVRFTAGEIRRMVMEEGMSYKDFALITGDVSRYRETARRQFDDMEIPLFIDDKANLSENSFVEMLCTV